ncbi:hypothetical protein XELAEV_18033032mg [Xenopus laevis]|uniref:Uncharacterized protein n=1 Tax=Xenopus laevis TaxID=8355 RepID=A0A974CJ73_XENLA|nr:hypothetical protein XELAEV_18033032mg [Xenopus laevis]
MWVAAMQVGSSREYLHSGDSNCQGSHSHWTHSALHPKNLLEPDYNEPSSGSSLCCFPPVSCENPAGPRAPLPPTGTLPVW